MNYIGKLYGMEVYLSDNVVETCIKFTRKQTRKFKNTRWVKKYLKKYSYEATKPSMNVIENYGKMIMHPLAWDFIREKANELNTSKKSINHA